MKNYSHPKALPYLFLTEMWERFGFYVVQGLLVLFMTESLGFSDDVSYVILGVFTALVYTSNIAGGFLADRVLGFKLSIVWGGLFLILGYAMLALPIKTLFYPALATIIVGNGLFKPNISSLLGTQYSIDDPRRDSGFTIFYIGINIGSFLAGLSSGYIRELIGWHTSFALASLGLVIGLITFAFGLRTIKEDPTRSLNLRHHRFLTKPWVFLYCILLIFFLSRFLSSEILKHYLLPGLGILLVIFLIVLTLRQQPQFRKRLFLLNILIMSSVVFWMMFFQIFFSANLFVERLVNKNWLGFHMPSTMFYAAESIFIIVLGPFFAWFWGMLSNKNLNPSAFTKFALGIMFAGLGFVALGCSTFFPDVNFMVNPLWVIFAYLLITIGELLLSPIGLSAVTTHAPPHLIGLMMGVWFVGTGFGGIFAGLLAQMASVPETMTAPLMKLTVYQHAFFNYAYIAFAVAFILFFVKWLFKKKLQRG